MYWNQNARRPRRNPPVSDRRLEVPAVYRRRRVRRGGPRIPSETLSRPITPRPWSPADNHRRVLSRSVPEHRDEVEAALALALALSFSFSFTFPPLRSPPIPESARRESRYTAGRSNVVPRRGSLVPSRRDRRGRSGLRRTRGATVVASTGPSRPERRDCRRYRRLVGVSLSRSVPTVRPRRGSVRAGPGRRPVHPSHCSLWQPRPGRPTAGYPRRSSPSPHRRRATRRTVR